MANSRIPGPLACIGPWIWPRTPGVLGINDQADPARCTRLGDTPGPAGYNDWGDARLRLLRGGLDLQYGLLCRAADGVPLALSAAGVAAAAAGTGKQEVTLDALTAIFSRADKSLLREAANELNTDVVAYGLDTPLRRAHFFAQVREEAGPLMAARVEDLTYSPAGLQSTFRYYRRNPAESETDGYERDPQTRRFTRPAAQETIANKVYADRNGNGNQASGDGWKFRGRGYIQVTGRDNYRAVTEQYKKLYPAETMDFEETPEKLADFPHDLRSAVCFWVMRGLPKLADAGSSGADVDAITAVINKDTDSYAHRRGHFENAWAAFG